MATKSKKNEKYLHLLFSFLKKREKIALSVSTHRFSDTEIRLMSEILYAKYKGERLISTQIASLLGVTRSAISQMVNRLEERGIVKRVADDVDRKIAYIELTEEALSLYKTDIEKCMEFVGELVEKFGEERFEEMCALLSEFISLIEEEKCKKVVNK